MSGWTKGSRPTQTSIDLSRPRHEFADDSSLMPASTDFYFTFYRTVIFIGVVVR